MMSNFLCLFLLGSFFISAEEKPMDTILSIKNYARLEKNDSIFRNYYKTYDYSEFKPLNKILLDVLLAERPSKYDLFPENTGMSDTLTNEEIRNRLGYKVYRHVVNDDEGNELYTEVLQTVIEDTSAIRFILGFNEDWSFDPNTLHFEKHVNHIEFVRKYMDEDAQKVRESCIAVIPNGKEANTQMQKIATISYEHSLLIPMDWVRNDGDADFVKRSDHAGLLNYSMVNENEEFNSGQRMQLIREIFENTINEKLKTIDFYSRKPIDKKELIARLKSMNGFISYTDIFESGYDESGMIDPDVVDAFIFTEDWYFDPETISWAKKVRELSFVKYSFDQSDSDYSMPQRNIFFTVVFE